MIYFTSVSPRRSAGSRSQDSARTRLLFFFAPALRVFTLQSSVISRPDTPEREGYDAFTLQGAGRSADNSCSSAPRLHSLCRTYNL